MMSEARAAVLFYNQKTKNVLAELQNNFVVSTKKMDLIFCILLQAQSIKTKQTIAKCKNHDI